MSIIDHAATRRSQKTIPKPGKRLSRHRYSKTYGELTSQAPAYPEEHEKSACYCLLPPLLRCCFMGPGCVRDHRCSMTKLRHMHVIAGTLRPSRDPGPGTALPLVTTPPPPPNWLSNLRAVKEWTRLARIFITHGLLTSVSLPPLATCVRCPARWLIYGLRTKCQLAT